MIKEERALMLQSSYDRYVKGIDFNPGYIFDIISELPFNDCLVQYDPDGWIDITTYYCNHITVVIYIDLEDSDNYLFTIYKGKRVLIRYELPLKDIVRVLTLGEFPGD